MLCLARAACIWGDKIVPLFVTGRTQKRLRPTVCIVAKDMKWCPVVVFGAIGATYLAFVSWMTRLNFPNLNACRQDNFLWNEVRGAVPTVAHIEVLDRPALVFALNNLPCLIPAAFWAWVVRPFKGF